MTRYQYLVLRNRKRLLLPEMTPAARRLFRKFSSRQYMVRFRHDPDESIWIWSPVTYCGQSPDLVYRIDTCHRPPGLTASDDIGDDE